MVHTSDCCLQDMQRRRLLAATLAAGGLLLLPSRSWAGDIRDLVGEVKVNNRKVGKRSSVYPGDTVETGSGAMIAFVVGNDAYVLRENARLELEGGNKDTFARALRLLTGGLLAVFGKSSTTRQLHTQTVTAGIRGTGIYMESEPSRTYFCTCYGAVEFEVAGSGERKLRACARVPGQVVAGQAVGALLRPAAAPGDALRQVAVARPAGYLHRLSPC